MKLKVRMVVLQMLCYKWLIAFSLFTCGLIAASNRLVPLRICDSNVCFVSCIVIFLWVSVGLICEISAKAKLSLFDAIDSADDGVYRIFHAIRRIERELPLEAFKNRGRRPCLCFVLWFTKWTTKRLQKWMGIQSEDLAVNVEDGADGGAAQLDSGVIIIGKILLSYPEAFLAVLCHELVHFMMRKFKIHPLIVKDEEYFTDVMCCYIGLGDVMLNGCVATSKEESWKGNYIETRYGRCQIGYLTPLEFAIAEIVMRELCSGTMRTKKSYNGVSKVLIKRAEIKLLKMNIQYKKRSGQSNVEYLNAMCRI